MNACSPKGDMAVSQVWTDPVTGQVVGSVTRDGFVQAAGFQPSGGCLFIPATAGAPAGTPAVPAGFVAGDAPIVAATVGSQTTMPSTVTTGITTGAFEVAFNAVITP